MVPYDVVGNALLAVATVLAAYIARRAHQSGKKIDKLANSDLDNRIRQAVKEALANSQGDEIRSLIDAIIWHARNEDR